MKKYQIINDIFVDILGVLKYVMGAFAALLYLSSIIVISFYKSPTIQAHQLAIFFNITIYLAHLVMLKSIVLFLINLLAFHKNEDLKIKSIRTIALTVVLYFMILLAWGVINWATNRFV